ncbi:MAG: amidohydrolase family protein, partial [Candidatus Heimdallarchaeota archaeon]|nr:amidohydrolase family protein [Candidatus Heimdallarchaeota archaeon]
RVKNPMYSYIALKSSQEYIKYGFTTLRDCGGEAWGASLRRAFDQNMFPGPRLLVAQNFLMQWGNQEEMGPDEYLEIQRKHEVISGPDGVKHAVRERKRSGSDFIKTTTTGGVLHGMESQLDRSLWTQEELKAMVDEAERLGMHVAAHAHGNEGIYQATLAGVRSIEHCSMPTEETLKLMKKKNTYLVATHSPQFLLEDPDLIKKLVPEIIQKGRTVLAKRSEAHKLAYDMGIKIALGTDAPVGRDHCHSPTELSLMVKNIGVTPAEALKMATINAAEAIKLEEQVGSITKDKFADFLILSKDPLVDVDVIANKDNIESVIKDGRIVSKKGILIQ